MNPSHHSTKRCEVLREELSPEIREQWTKHFNKFNKRKYMILAAPQMEEFALSIEKDQPERFMYHKSGMSELEE